MIILLVSKLKAVPVQTRPGHFTLEQVLWHWR